MDYGTTLKYLDEIQGHGIKLGLDTMIRLLAAMADPHQAYPAVVVAGTNGKGSVCAMLDSILRECGLRSGRYTSPHLVRYEERIAVNGAPVTQSEFAAAVTTVSDHIATLTASGALEVHPTHFEVLTAAAMHHFRQARIDAGVLEVGMGGRLDAVAVARTSVAVITNVRLDHTKHLGQTEEAIAVQKAGVIREGCLAITGESRPGPLGVIRDEARARGVRLIEKDHEARVTISEWDAPVRFALATSRAVYPDLVVPFAGRHQIDNAVLAVLAAEAFRAPVRLPAEAVASGLARARWPGRLQVVGHAPLVMLDGAHNPAGSEALANALDDLRKAGRFERLCLVLGVLQDKDLAPMLQHLLPVADHVVVTRGASARFRPPEELASAVGELGRDAIVAADLNAAIHSARSWAGPHDAICLAGSLYLVGDAMPILGVEPY